MSEYQYIGFRAAERPVSDENLAFMRKQSTRSDVTPWAFDNEYHYGDFHGDAHGMIRRGYDVHLHYANYGIRTLMIGLPHDVSSTPEMKPYFATGSLEFLKEKTSGGGILAIQPYLEPGDRDELWDLNVVLDELVPLRAEILSGDLRPLYLAHLAMIVDDEHDPDEAIEGPVPAGLGTLTKAQQSLANLYSLSESLIAAAAEGNPQQPLNSEKKTHHYATWLQSLSQSSKDEWLLSQLENPQSNMRTEMLAMFQQSRSVSRWPTVVRKRTVTELQTRADEIEKKVQHTAAEKAAAKRAQHLVALATNPHEALRETEQLVCKRSHKSYSAIATILTDLREALAGTELAGLPENHARKLSKDNPTLKLLISELRRSGFLAK